MRCFTRARKQVKKRIACCRVARCGAVCSRPRVSRWRLVLAIACAVVWAQPAWAQDSGSKEKEFFGNGAEIAVTVHDGSGEPISAPTMVRLIRDGTISSGQGVTSHGRMSFIVTTLGEFTVVVEAAGYPRTEKEVSVRSAVRTLVDIYLRRAPAGENIVGTPGKPLLAPKAKEAFDRGLRALGADQLLDAQRFVAEAARLAPGHPDVLYAQGVLYLKQRDFGQAQSVLEKATQVDPNHARAFAALGMALSDQGKYEAAIAPLEKSLSLDAGVGYEAHWALAKAYYQSAQYDEALTSAAEALAESKGKAPEIALLVAQALTAVGRYDEAARALREFLLKHGDRPDAGKARRWLEGLQSSGRVRQ
jgi:Flp pilus assembly protein TadD